MATTPTSITAKHEEVLMVGNNNAFAEIKNKFTNLSIAGREVISIVGMGGIGKTTLAKKVYEDKGIKSHFDIRAWITVSQSYSLNDILQRLLQSLNQPHDPTGEQSESFELKDKIRKLLLGTRYLIIIDDIWNTEAWDDMQISFPKQSMGSWILLTTRLTYVATHVSSGGVPYIMSTLSKDESWDLFCKKVFKKECFPPHDEFEKIVKNIMMKCKGLPLAVIVIAGILSKAKMQVEDWQNIAKDVKVALSSTSYEEQNCEKILFLSYNHLPDNLKTCFLYLGVFPEDYEILVKQLVRYWVAGEFLEVEASDHREEVAWQTLQDLMDRNLVLVEKRGASGKMKNCKVHDLTREMCLRLAKGKNILHVIADKFQVGQSSRGLGQENGYFWVSLQSIPKNCHHISCLGLKHSTLHNCHSFLAMLPSNTIRTPIFVWFLHYNLFTSIKVLDILQIYLPFIPSPSEINNLHELRYLALYSEALSPSSLSILNSLNNLQTFILRTRVCKVVKLSIPKTPQLMQLHILNGSSFDFSDGEENLMSLEKLTSVVLLSDLCCTNKELMMRIPNVKKLGIRYTEGKSICSKHPINLLVRYREGKSICSSEHPINLIRILSYLHQLENISFYGCENESLFFGYKSMYIPKSYDFPPKLNKLTFYKTQMELKIMTILGRLPNLQVLQLKWDIFNDLKREWEQTEMGFPKLKVLVFENLSLTGWVDSGFFFPKLECLVLNTCNLVSLPYECLSESPCLKLIDLDGCEESVSIFAKRLQDGGNGQIEVHIKNERSLRGRGGIIRNVAGRDSAIPPSN